MRIVLDLEPADIQRLRAALQRSRRLAEHIDEIDVIDAAKHALDTLCAASVPAYVRKRLGQVQRLITMLEDEAWALAAPERAEIVATLAYFSDPDDLVPDDIDVIGLLDDAILLELMARELRPVLRAYADFCAFRLALGEAPVEPAVRRERAARLAALRQRLHVRMRRQLRAAETATAVA